MLRSSPVLRAMSRPRPGPVRVPIVNPAPGPRLRDIERLARKQLAGIELTGTRRPDPCLCGLPHRLPVAPAAPIPCDAGYYRVAWERHVRRWRVVPPARPVEYVTGPVRELWATPPAPGKQSIRHWYYGRP